VSFLKIANREISAGIPVIPVKAGQKSPPLIEGGSSSGSTNPQQIEAWAAKFPDANVGVVCRLNGIMIVDDDEGVVEQSGIAVRTRVVESSPGHKQYYFKHTPATAALGNLPQRDGFSFRADNHYGIAAGSLHPDGHRYKLLIDAPIQPMPQELLRYLQQRNENAKGNRLGASDRPAWGLLEQKIGEGEGRNDDMTRLAGMIWDWEIEEEDFFEALRRQCELRHDPPYPESRMRELIQRAMQDWKPSTCPAEWEDMFDVPKVGHWSGLKWYESEDHEWRGIFHSYEEFENAPPLKFAIHGWLQAEGITMYGALPGHGKTLLALSTVKALLTGEPLFGHKYFAVERSKRVLYLCPEAGLGPLTYRLKLFRLGSFVKSGELLYRTLGAKESVQITDKRILKAAEGADVFLDTAVRFMDGEENSASDQRIFAQNLFSLLSAGARSVVGLHHAPKSFAEASYMTLENCLRGTSELGAMLSTAWREEDR